jgi:hypothetical protein
VRSAIKEVERIVYVKRGILVFRAILFLILQELLIVQILP